MLKLCYRMFNCHDQESYQANARDTYRKHYEMIRRKVPKDRLLDYKLGSGWEPLCTFLGKPIPEQPFPWKNESKEFAAWMRKIQLGFLKDGLREFTKKSTALAMIGTVAFAVWALIA